MFAPFPFKPYICPGLWQLPLLLSPISHCSSQFLSHGLSWILRKWQLTLLMVADISIHYVSSAKLNGSTHLILPQILGGGYSYHLLQMRTVWTGWIPCSVAPQLVRVRRESRRCTLDLHPLPPRKAICQALPLDCSFLDHRGLIRYTLARPDFQKTLWHGNTATGSTVLSGDNFHGDRKSRLKILTS